jgi:bacterioferritin (cytochrome b1)
MESSDKAIARLDYGIKKYQEQITRLRVFQKRYKGTKVEENLEKEIKKFEGIIQDLENLKPIVLARLTKPQDKKPETPGKIIRVVTENLTIGEEVNEKLEESEKTAEKSQEKIIEILQKIAEDGKQENKELKKQMRELQKSGNANHGEAIRVAWTFGIGGLLIIFVLAGLT